MTRSVVEPEEVAAERFAASAKHLALVMGKIRRLEDARKETEEQLYHAIGCAYRAGEMSEADLLDLYASLRRNYGLSVTTKTWNRNIPVSSRALSGKLQFRHLTDPNSPDGSHWIGEYPLPFPDQPAPPYGASAPG